MCVRCDVGLYSRVLVCVMLVWSGVCDVRAGQKADDIAEMLIEEVGDVVVETLFSFISLV